MIALWSVVAALSLAWLVGDAVLGLIVAPQLFGLAAREGVDSAFAGLVFGEVLHRWVVITGVGLVIPAIGLLSVIAGRTLKRSGMRAAVPSLVAAIVLLGPHVVTASLIDHGRREAAALRAAPDAARMEAFRTSFHARSRAAVLAEMLAALAVAAAAVTCAHRCGRTQAGRPAT